MNRPVTGQSYRKWLMHILYCVIYLCFFAPCCEMTINNHSEIDAKKPLLYGNKHPLHNTMAEFEVIVFYT